jgi:hypothetical protein
MAPRRPEIQFRGLSLVAYARVSADAAEIAQVILSDVERYGGPVSAKVRWAEETAGAAKA